MTCKCERCDTCGGTGHIWRHMDGDISPTRCDDLDELVTCPDCNGRGIDECEECAMAEEEEE